MDAAELDRPLIVGAIIGSTMVRTPPHQKRFKANAKIVITFRNTRTTVSVVS